MLAPFASLARRGVACAASRSARRVRCRSLSSAPATTRARGAEEQVPAWTRARPVSGSAASASGDGAQAQRARAIVRMAAYSGGGRVERIDERALKRPRPHAPAAAASTP
jgi:hypothetical protein